MISFLVGLVIGTSFSGIILFFANKAIKKAKTVYEDIQKIAK